MKHQVRQKLELGKKLEIREMRIFSEAVKKQAVKDLLSKHSTIKQVASYHQTSFSIVRRFAKTCCTKCVWIGQVQVVFAIIYGHHDHHHEHQRNRELPLISC